MDVRVHAQAHVLVLLMQYIAVLDAILYVQQHAKMDVKSLVQENAKLLVHPHVKILARQDVKELVKMAVVVAVVIAAFWDAVIPVWVVVVRCSSDYGEGTKRLLAGRHGKDHHVYRDERLPISLQILLLGWQKLQGKDALEYCQASYRLCA